MRRHDTADISKHVVVKIDLRYRYSELPKEDFINSENITEPEETLCSVFGCRKKLTLLETLCGNRCIDHQGKQTDITNCISI